MPEDPAATQDNEACSCVSTAGVQLHKHERRWWLEIGVGWTRDLQRYKPLSYAVITEDHFGMVDGHQHTYENYHWVPTTGGWVNYYTGRMPTGGRLVRMKHHVHMSLLHKALFIAASSDELELFARPTGPDGEDMDRKEVRRARARSAASNPSERPAAPAPAGPAC